MSDNFTVIAICTAIACAGWTVAVAINVAADTICEAIRGRK